MRIVEYSRGRQPLARVPKVARRKVWPGTRSDSMLKQILSA